MKRALTLAISIFFFTCLLSLGVGSHAQAACSEASLKGTYALSCTGTDNGAPIAIVGLMTLDGKGQLSVTNTISLNGTILQGVSATGTYTVNADCTGSTVIDESLHYNLAISDNTREFYSIQTDPGTVVTCRKKKQ